MSENYVRRSIPELCELVETGDIVGSTGSAFGLHHRAAAPVRAPSRSGAARRQHHRVQRRDRTPGRERRPGAPPSPSRGAEPPGEAAARWRVPLREKYGKKNRQWVQIILLGNAKHHEPVSYEVHLLPSSEPESTKRQLATLLKQDADIIAAGGDGAMDDKGLWNFCAEQGIRPIIKPDMNARDDTDCNLRNLEVMKRNLLGHEQWAKDAGYGHRWPATEGINSAIKRIFGEQIAATSERGMLQEAACKIWAYQRIKRYGEA